MKCDLSVMSIGIYIYIYLSLKAMYIYEMKCTHAEVYELVSGTNNENTCVTDMGFGTTR